MSLFARAGARQTGSWAFAISLLLHSAVLGLALARVGGFGIENNSRDGPAVLHLLELDESEEAAPTSWPSGGGSEIGVGMAPENIVPALHFPQLSPSASSAFPAHNAEPGKSAEGTSGPARHVGSLGQNLGGTAPGQGSGALFPTGPRARRVVYVIDRSASMGQGGRFGVAARELLASLAALPPNARFQIVVYHDVAESLLPGRRELLPATAENVQRVRERLETLPIEGSTRHLPALQLALSLNPEVIYFLTDADDLKDADRREATRLNRGRAVIHTIELTTANRGHANMPLQVLARENRGRYVAVDLITDR